MKTTPDSGDVRPDQPQDTQWGFWWATVVGLVGFVCVCVLVWVTVRSFL